MSTDDTTPQERRGPRLRGKDRDRIRAAIAEGYPGASIRVLADQHHLSFGLTRTLLLEAGVELRSSRRRPKTAEQ
jgi:hypothetical protein